MRPPRFLAGLVLLLAATSTPAGAQFFKKYPAPAAPDPTIPLGEMGESERTLALTVLERPTLSARGPSETFPCQPDQYFWFLDHPDRAVTAWRRLGAKCVNITPRGQGVFGWSDDNGSDLVWHTLYRGTDVRVWYAEGKVRPAPVLPLIPVKAVLVMHHDEAASADGAPLMKHRADIYVVTDSKAAAAVTKAMGQSAPKLAEQGLGQLQLFFSGLSWYIHRHPDRADTLLK